MAILYAVLIPMPLYGSESWVRSKNYESKINAVEMLNDTPQFSTAENLRS